MGGGPSEVVGGGMVESGGCNEEVGGGGMVQDG